jgi:hypothetical protein
LEVILQRGGNMLDTCTKLHFCIPASRNARSKECNSSLCVPTPFVTKIFLGTRLGTFQLLFSAEFGEILFFEEDAAEKGRWCQASVIRSKRILYFLAGFKDHSCPGAFRLFFLS